MLLGLLASMLLPAPNRTDTTRDLYLANGLRVTLVEDSNARRAAIWLHVAVGSADEGVRPRGVAHLAEHIYVRGPAHATRFGQRAGTLGGDGVNAGTDFDGTNFYWTVPVESLRPALAMEAERLADPGAALTRDVLRKERRIVMAEMRETAWTLDTQVKRVAFPVIYGPAHPHAVLPEGRERDLESIKISAVRSWFEQWYRPGNMRLIVVGAFDAATLEPVIRRLFAHLPGLDGPAGRAVAFPIAFASARAAPMTLDAEAASVTLYGAAPGRGHADSIPLERAAAALRDAFARAASDRFGPSTRATLAYRTSARTGNVLLRLVFDRSAPPPDAEPFMRAWLRSASPHVEEARARQRSPLHPPPGTVLAKAYETLVGEEALTSAYERATSSEVEGAFQRWFGPDLLALATTKAAERVTENVLQFETSCWRVRTAADANPQLTRILVSARTGPCPFVAAPAALRSALLQRFREERGWTYSVREQPTAPGVIDAYVLSFSVPLSRTRSAARMTAQLVRSLQPAD